MKKRFLSSLLIAILCIPVFSQSVFADNGNIVITKNPTSEALTIGGKTWFIAHADNAYSLTWFMMDPNGQIYSLDDTMSIMPGLSLQALEGDTIAVSNVPGALNGWAVLARFDNNFGYVFSEPAQIYVGDFLNAYANVFDDYRKFISVGVEAYYDIGATFYTTTELQEYKCNGDPSGVCVHAMSGNDLGYYFKDINKDGIPELFIGCIYEKHGGFYSSCIGDMFTLQNGQPRRVLASSERCVYRLRTDNHISYHEWGGNGWYSDYLFQFTPDGLEVVNGINTSYSDVDKRVHYYLLDRMMLSEVNENGIDISKEEYDRQYASIHELDFDFSVTRF